MTIPDNTDLYDKIVRSWPPRKPRDDPDFRKRIATYVLHAYAEDSLSYTGAEDFVSPLLDRAMFRDLVEIAWEGRDFKDLGQRRMSFPFFRADDDSL
jgi:hypothetical protein